MLRLCNISKIYNENEKVLQNVSLDVKAGEIYGLLGRSGAGKSTLLRCSNLLVRPTQGQVFIKDTELTQLNPQKLRCERQRIGMVFQHFNLLNSRTVYENIALPLELQGRQKDIPKLIPELLDLVGLEKKKNAYPNALSGGQKQRVAIARALSIQPDILLSDEATSALDPESTQSILTLLKRINRELGLTIFLVSHELDVIKNLCHRVGVMDHGQLLEEGSTVEIFAHPKHEVTKQLVLPKFDVQSLHLKKNPHACVLKLTFVGNQSEEPIISSLIKKYHVDINILQAQIDTVLNTTIGYTICELTGASFNLEQILQYLSTTQVSVEVLYV